MERFIHEGIYRMAGRQSLINQTGDFEVTLSADWEQEKSVHEVLNIMRGSSVILPYFPPI